MKAITIIISVLFPILLMGQEKRDLSKQLNKKFYNTFKNESFEISDYSIKKAPNGTQYWIIDIVPQKAGVYFLKHLFQYIENWGGYKNNSVMYVIKVGDTGTPRLFSEKEPNPYTSMTCRVDDTISIPVYLDKHIENHEFSLEEEKRIRDIYRKTDTVNEYPRNSRTPKWKVTNHVEELNFIRINSNFAIHRHLRNESVTHSVTFEAIKTGVFIIKIRNKELPIIIKHRNAKISKLVTQTVGYQWEGNGASYSLPYKFHKEMKYALLRVGDILNISFMSYVQNVKNPKVIDLNVSIIKKKLDVENLNNLTTYK